MNPKLLLCLALVLSGTLPAVARVEFICSTNADGDTVTITRYAGAGGAVRVPSTINGLTVTRIGDWAFARNPAVTSVTIPDSVTDIGDGAFTATDSHSSLTNVLIGSHVGSIGRGAFVFCEKLTRIKIPASVTDVGVAFGGCFGLKEILVDANNPAYISMDGVLFNKSQTVLVQYPPGKAGNYLIPDTVTNIVDYALWNCPNLTSLTIPEGVTTITKEALAACHSLTNIIIPASVTNLELWAFDSCVGLKSVYFRGNAPGHREYRGYKGVDIYHAFNGDSQAIIYYLPETTGWGTTFDGRPTVRLSGVSSDGPTAAQDGSDVEPSNVAAAAQVKLQVVTVDSEETNGENGYGKNAVDGDPNTYWHTQWHGNSPGLPHEIVIELFPPAVIKGFTCLPRQDESDHGTIKDYEFYVSDDGTNFGQPVKKGVFAPGKGEKLETFAPVKCRFIKLRAISEINGLPWTSAAEIGVVQSGEDTSIKDYWRGDLGPTNEAAAARRESTGPDAIDRFVAGLSADGGLWINGIDVDLVTDAETPQAVVSETFRTAKFQAGLMTNYQILDMRKIHIGEFPGTCTVVLADTNLGQMIVLLQPGRTPGHWWRRVYDAHLPLKRLY